MSEVILTISPLSRATSKWFDSSYNIEPRAVFFFPRLPKNFRLTSFCSCHAQRNKQANNEARNSPRRNFLLPVLKQGDWCGRPHIAEAARKAARRVRRSIHLGNQVWISFIILDDHILVAAANRLEGGCCRCGDFCRRRRRCSGCSFRFLHFNHRHEMTRLGEQIVLTISMFTFHRSGIITDFIIWFNWALFCFRTIFTVCTHTFPLFVIHCHRFVVRVWRFAVSPSVDVRR